MNNTSVRTPQEKVCGYEYTVRRGDSFYLIANRLGIPLRDLLEANADINPARLMVGDVLCIPMEEDDAPPVQEPQEPQEPEVSPGDDLDVPAVPETTPPTVIPTPSPTCAAGEAHTVTPGETAADIQLRANVNRYTLQTANPSTDLDALTAGQVLCVPSQNTACPVAATYLLQAEDTLESTALRLNTSLAALLRANPCLAPADFVPGACIYIPEN